MHANSVIACPSQLAYKPVLDIATMSSSVDYGHLCEDVPQEFQHSK